MMNVQPVSPRQWLGAVLLMYAVLTVVPENRSAQAALGSCGQPVSAGMNPVASDALEILRTAVGTATCGECDSCVCDVNSSDTVTAGDALNVLQRAVGLAVNLGCSCPAGPGCGFSGVDQDCLSGVCAPNLRCDVTAYNSQTSNITAATCHVGCGKDADCDLDQQCRPSTPGFYDIQRDGSGNPVSCVAGNSSPCDVASGYACTALVSGQRCAREISACGTPVPMADLTGPDTITAEMWCNSGQPFELPEVGIVGGSRFCDRLDSLATPPVTIQCQRQNPAHPSSFGLCFARCEMNNGTLTDCPAGMHCSTDPATSAFGTFLADPTNTTYGVKQCTTAGDCGDDKYLCEEFIGLTFCYRPFATCSYNLP